MGRLSLRNSSVVDGKTPVLLAVIAGTERRGKRMHRVHLYSNARALLARKTGGPVI